MNSPTDQERPLLVNALQGKAADRVPVWFMRQAGRYLPEYHEVRNHFEFTELCRNVDAAFKVTMQPYERFAVDGVIMFQDILTPLWCAGIDVRFEEGRGPILSTPVDRLDKLSVFDGFDARRDCHFVAELLQKLKSRILEEGHNRPGLLGFAGAPFTLASYLIEGGSTRTFSGIKSVIFGRPDLYHALAERLTDMTIAYLEMQLAAGADAVQIFESWGGVLSQPDYEEFAAPYTRRIIETLRSRNSQPVILFTGNAAHLLDAQIDQGPTAISLDWRIQPQVALDRVPADIALQGNLDPLVLYGSTERVVSQTRSVKEGLRGHKGGYVFNLGHGINPKTPIENVEAMLATVRE